MNGFFEVLIDLPRVNNLETSHCPVSQEEGEDSHSCMTTGEAGGSFTLPEAFQVAPGPTQPQFGPRRHFILDSSLSKTTPFSSPNRTFTLQLHWLFSSPSQNSSGQVPPITSSHSDHSMDKQFWVFQKLPSY